MNSFAASAYGRRICLLEFDIVLNLKDSFHKSYRKPNQRQLTDVYSTKGEIIQD